jgi:hypothetical protein
MSESTRRTYSSKKASLGDFVEECFDSHLDLALTLPVCGLKLDDFPGNAVQTRTRNHEVYVLYLNDGEPYIKPGQDLCEIQLGTNHFLKDGTFDVEAIRLDFRLQRHQSPWASFTYFLREMNQDQISTALQNLGTNCGLAHHLAAELVRWLVIQADMRSGKFLYENREMLLRWKDKLSLFSRGELKAGPETVSSLENVDDLEVSLEAEIDKLEDSFVREIDEASTNKREATRKKQLFQRLMIALNMEKVISCLRLMETPRFEGMSQAYTLGFLDAVFTLLDSEDLANKYYGRLKDLFHSQKSSESVRNERWLKRDAIMRQALQDAERLWAKGESMLHNQMAEYLARGYPKLSKRSIQEHLKPIAKKYGRLRGVKGVRKAK